MSRVPRVNEFPEYWENYWPKKESWLTQKFSAVLGQLAAGSDRRQGELQAVPSPTERGDQQQLSCETEKLGVLQWRKAEKKKDANVLEWIPLIGKLAC